MSTLFLLAVRLRCFVAPTFSRARLFICPAVSLYLMELVRKVFFYDFRNVIRVSMYARYAKVLDEKNAICLPMIRYFEPSC